MHKIVLLLIKTMASQQIEMLCGEQKEKKANNHWEFMTPGLSHQCSVTKLQPLDNYTSPHNLTAQSAPVKYSCTHAATTLNLVSWPACARLISVGSGDETTLNLPSELLAVHAT